MTNVLVVDDNPMDQRIAGACLDQCGMNAIYAADGAEALGVFEEETPDIILTDLDMPELDGLELVRRLQVRAPAVPVILMTAKGSEDIAAEALKAGASSYVAKRHIQHELQSVLHKVSLAAQARQRRQDVFQYVTGSQMQFVLGNDEEASLTLVSHLQEQLLSMDLCTEGQLLTVGTALIEALNNATDRGNLELEGSLRRDNRAVDYATLRSQRMSEQPHGNRRVFVSCEMTHDDALFCIRDEGPGFDISTVPDPDDADCLTQDGRGLVLIQTFMDEVSFSDTGKEIQLRLYADHA